MDKLKKPARFEPVFVFANIEMTVSKD